eukprot:4764185-Pyramimonas_sp.AAC.1
MRCMRYLILYNNPSSSCTILSAQTSTGCPTPSTPPTGTSLLVRLAFRASRTRRQPLLIRLARRGGTSRRWKSAIGWTI